MRPTSVAVVGGTGAQGSGLAWRLARVGVRVVIGSRDAARARDAAAGLPRPAAAATLTGATNAGACAACDAAILSVPYEGLAGTVGPLAGVLDGKLAISCVNVLAFDERGPYPLAVAAGSAAEEIAALLPGSLVAVGFTTVSATHLRDPDAALDEDVLVLGDDPGAVTGTVALADAIPGLRGVAAGPLRLAGVVEALTAVVLSVNRAHKANAGVRLTGLRPSAPHRSG